MTAHLTVTQAQVLAAQLQLRLADEIGETVSALVKAIAQAKTEPRRFHVRPDASEQVSANGSAPAASVEPAPRNPAPRSA